MDELYVAEAVFRILRDRRQGVTDLMIYGNVKSMEQYRELMGNLESLTHVEQELKSLLDKQEQSL
jgi:hypothetical protein|tara:strand:- start:1222 stop:1416 length:195 start_codon:yes stop_codon:yes gene_type:complete